MHFANVVYRLILTGGCFHTLPRLGRTYFLTHLQEKTQAKLGFIKVLFLFEEGISWLVATVFTSKRRAQASLPLPLRAQLHILHSVFNLTGVKRSAGICILLQSMHDVFGHSTQCWRKNNLVIQGVDVLNESFLGPSPQSMFDQRD